MKESECKRESTQIRNQNNIMRRKEFLKDALFGTIMIAGIPMVGCKQGNSVYTSDEHQPRTVTNIDFDWLFHLGGQKGAEAISFDDQSWRSLDLPHDWSIEGEFDLDNPTGWRGGYMPAGIGWYRKHFNWDSQWEGKKVSIRLSLTVKSGLMGTIWENVRTDISLLIMI